MSISILFEDAGYADFMPLAHWRPVMDLRCGRTTLAERSARVLGVPFPAWWVRPGLRATIESRGMASAAAAAGTLLINARWLCAGAVPDGPTPCVGVLGDSVAYVRCDEQLAARLDAEVMLDPRALEAAVAGVSRVDAAGLMLAYPWDLIVHNGSAIAEDAAAFDGGASAPAHATVLAPEAVHISANTVIRPGVVLDAESGPVFIDQGAVIMPNVVIEGPSYIGPHTRVAAGAWIRGSVSLGPCCKVGGEVAVSILQGYSNKAHHGFVGHTVMGEWVNFGAGTTTSNLKNTYGEVSVALHGTPIETGQTFIGSIVGDFVKTGINQSLTTGCVLGCAAMIATGGVAPRFVPSFRFVTDRGDEPYDIVRCLEVAERVMGRRGIEMTAAERAWFLQLPDRVGHYERG